MCCMVHMVPNEMETEFALVLFCFSTVYKKKQFISSSTIPHFSVQSLKSSFRATVHHHLMFM